MATWKMKTGVLAAMTVAVLTAEGAVPVRATSKYVVSFRLTNWKAAHFDDSASAKNHYDTLRRLGCEAKQDAHKGHFDVSYRAGQWRRISMKTDAEAHQWAHWLAENGFETVFVQPVHPGHLETIAYRLTGPKSSHLDTRSQADSQADTLRMLGCEVKQGSHGGHYDVSYRCPKWRVIAVEVHDAAHQWQKWLKGNGFETRHEHKTTQTTGGTSRRR